MRHKVYLILPLELYQTQWAKIRAELADVKYARLFMPLSGLLEGDFLSKYIKTGM